MYRTWHRLLSIPALALLLVVGAGPGTAVADAIDGAAAGGHRDPANTPRDRYRHPAETLRFFGLEPHMTVVEIWPASGWYTEILAPVLRDNGRLYAAQFPVDGDVPAYRRGLHQKLLDRIKAHPDVYGAVQLTEMGPGRMDFAPPGSADMVLTFRNVHNWVEDGFAPEVFKGMFRALKPGGVLGVVDHRAKPGTSMEQMKESGYVTEEHVIGLAKEAGFRLEERSEVNANPADSRGHEMGVWTLPPSLAACRELPAGAQKSACEEKYRAIGESDRMTLKFRKPQG